MVRPRKVYVFLFSFHLRSSVMPNGAGRPGGMQMSSGRAVHRDDEGVGVVAGREGSKI